MRWRSWISFSCALRSTCCSLTCSRLRLSSSLSGLLARAVLLFDDLELLGFQLLKPPRGELRILGARLGLHADLLELAGVTLVVVFLTAAVLLVRLLLATLPALVVLAAALVIGTRALLELLALGFLLVEEELRHEGIRPVAAGLLVDLEGLDAHRAHRLDGFGAGI